MGKRKIVKHVVQEGSREHVIWWDSRGRHCSCKECEINQKTVEK